MLTVPEAIVRWIPLVIPAVLLAGCATFKELEPEPEVFPSERGYIELSDDGDSFELENGNKYFIRFPHPVEVNTALVLATPEKPFLHAYLTDKFDDGEGPVNPLQDEATASDSLFVYFINPGVPTYFWVIDSVDHDLILKLRYRYMPQWRYSFESKYSGFKEVLANNTADRSTFNAIDANYDTDQINTDKEIADLNKKTAAISAISNDLADLERVFPPNTVASNDTAYGQYLALKEDVDKELQYQEDYAAVLGLFGTEKKTRGNTAAFIEAAPSMSGVVSRKQRLTPGVNQKISKTLSGRLAEVEPYLDNLLRSKKDIRRISPDPSLDAVTDLYAASDQPMPKKTQSMIRFINRFNVEVDGLRASDSTFAAVKSQYLSQKDTATVNYSTLASKAAGVRAAVPESQASRIEQTSRYECAMLLSKANTTAVNRATDLEKSFRTGVTTQNHIRGGNWAFAEEEVRHLHQTPSLSGSSDVQSIRSSVVVDLEEEIFEGVKRTSSQRIDTFIAQHQLAINDVPALYADSAFMPVHELSFSSGGQKELTRKRSEVQTYLDQIKHVRFPESSIKGIYAEFTQAPNDSGVEKARAIVEHGKFYKGTDKQVQGLIVECDVQAAKWIVKPKEYRRLFALPVSSNPQGTNEYMFRIQLQIPSEAQFPVFDINLKLPKEVAEKAGREQWFESITINKVPLKNEGRFRITSPTAANDYETLITPVQMDKGGKNILEVRFNYPGFRVFEVSAMAQVPIIRKN